MGAILKVKLPDGTWADIPALVGPEGVGFAELKQLVVGLGDGAENIYYAYRTDGTLGGSISVRNGSKGSAGYTPVKGTDYFTAAEQEAMVQQVLDALGTPVWGQVDEDNVITLTGELAAGVYTLVYEDAEGNRNQIGTLDFSQDGAMAIPWLEGYSCGGSSGTVNEVNAEYMTTEKIPLEDGYEYTLSIGQNNGSWSLFVYYYTEDNAALGRNEAESFQAGTAHTGKSVVLSPKAGAVDFKLQSYCGGEHAYDTVKANVTLTKRYVG